MTKPECGCSWHSRKRDDAERARVVADVKRECAAQLLAEVQAMYDARVPHKFGPYIALADRWSVEADRDAAAAEGEDND